MTTPIPDQFRLDLPAWLATLTVRDRRIISDMARNKSTTDLSRKFKLSPARISQLRREFHVDWRQFCGDVVVTSQTSTRRPA